MSDLTMEVRGDRIPIEIEVRGDGSEAVFVATLGETPFRSTQWAALRSTLLTETRKRAKKLNIPYADPSTLENGRIYAVHAGTGAAMVEWESGRKEQVSRLPYDALKELTPEEQAEGRRLAAAVRTAQKALEAWTKPLAFNVRQALDVALRED